MPKIIKKQWSRRRLWLFKKKNYHWQWRWMDSKMWNKKLVSTSYANAFCLCASGYHVNVQSLMTEHYHVILYFKSILQYGVYSRTFRVHVQNNDGWKVLWFLSKFWIRSMFSVRTTWLPPSGVRNHGRRCFVLQRPRLPPQLTGGGWFEAWRLRRPLFKCRFCLGSADLLRCLYWATDYTWRVCRNSGSESRAQSVAFCCSQWFNTRRALEYEINLIICSSLFFLWRLQASATSCSNSLSFSSSLLFSFFH